MTLERRAMQTALPAYEIGEEIGRGAFGIVFRGHHRQLARDVAVKQLPRALAADPAVQQRFLSEARTAASLHHPSIVPVYDFVERDGLCLLILEYVDGGTLGHRIAAGPLDQRDAVRIVADVLDGLQYAHERGVVHRDVKPDNILLTSAGVAKLGDFGIAKIVGGDASVTAAGAVMGTPAYLAPEVAMGQEASPASDVYSCAAVLYEALSGRLPHPPAATITATLLAIVQEPPHPLGVVAPGVDPALAAIVMRALSPDPAHRPPSAAAFAAELRAAALGAPAPVVPRPAPPTVIAPPVAPVAGATVPVVATDPRATVVPRDGAAVAATAAGPRRRLPLIAAALLVVALVAGGAVWLLRDDGGSAASATSTSGAVTSASNTAVAPSSTAVATSADPFDTSGAPTDGAATTVGGTVSTYVAAVAAFKTTCDSRGVTVNQCQCMITTLTDQFGQGQVIQVVNQLRQNRKVRKEVGDVIQQCLITVD